MQSLWMIAAALLFSVMGLCVKLGAAFYNTWEMVFYRGLVGLIVLIGLMLARRPRAHSATSTSALSHLKQGIATNKLPRHMTRSLSGTMALLLWFYTIRNLPLGTATTLNYSAPLYVGTWIVIGALRAGRAPSSTMIFALLGGFVGVILVLRPTLAHDQWLYGVIGAFSAILSAIAYLSVKALSQAGEPESRIVFYFCAVNGTAGLIGALLFGGFHAHNLYSFALVIGIGVSATLAQLAMTRAYGSGRTLLAANLSFLTIVFSTVWGLVFFKDVLQTMSLIGMAVIIGAGVLATLVAARDAGTFRSKFTNKA